MRVVLSTLGTLGDLLPYLALGRTLQAKGHRVRVAASPSLCQHVLRARLEAFPCYPDLSPELIRRHHRAFDHWPDASRGGLTPENGDQQETFDIDYRIRDLLLVCRGADLLIRNSTMTGEGIVQEILGVRSVHALVTPERLWHARFQNLLNELESGETSRNPEARRHFRWHQRCRQRAGLPEIPLNGWKGYYRPPALVGTSRHVLESFDTSLWNGRLCGFWFYDAPRWRSWQPDRELVAFMEHSPPPIVLSFSSQLVADPAQVVKLHQDAARRLGCRR
jgi:hypothetical protein